MLHMLLKHVVGWSPVSGNRKKIVIKTCKYVKVVMDGYDGYDYLVRALDIMFGSTNLMNEKKYMLS